MYGMLMWNENQPKRVMIEQRSILGVPFLCASIRRGQRTTLARRRAVAAMKRLCKLGVGRVVAPDGFAYQEELNKYGLYPVSTLFLRRELAADWVRAELTRRGMDLPAARVAVCSGQITGEVVRTVTELSLRHRYVMLSVPRGGEELSRRLRREYGVSLQLNPSRQELGLAAALAAFSEIEDLGNPVTLRLYDEHQPMPDLALPPELENQLPDGVSRLQLIAVLRQAGAIRADALSLETRP